MRILIVKLSAVGDVIHTLPLLTALRRLYPEAEISWAVEEAAADLLADHPDLDRLLVSRRKAWIRDLRRGRIAGPLGEMRAFWRALRHPPPYDLVIDVHGLLKSALIVAASGGRRKLGYASLQEGSGLFYDERIPEDLGKHAVERYLDFARHLAGPGGALPAVTFRIALGEAQERRVTELLAGLAGARRGDGGPAGAPERFAAVSPVALWETKLWDDGKFARLCDRMQRELGLAVVLTGAAAEPLAGIARRMETAALNLGGKTSLRELACLYRRAALVVSTDSGPMHLAAAVGTPVVALFGPTDPARTGPYGPGHRVVRTGIPCQPCLRKRCDDPRCLGELEVDPVFSAVEETLREKAGNEGIKG